MNAPLIREFRLLPRGRGVSCDANGAFIDSIPLLKRARESDSDVWTPRDAGELSAELSAHYGLLIDVSSKVAGLHAIAQALNAGDVVHAQLVTLHLQIPETPAPEGVTSCPNLIGKFVRELQLSGLLQKVWEPDEHPRWPAGAPESQGGQFAPKDTGELVADAEPETEESDSNEDDEARARDRAAWAAANAAGKEEDREREAEAAGQETSRMSRSRIDRIENARRRQEYWRNESKKDPTIRELESYLYSDPNLNLMRAGRPPIGNDDFPLELHHPDGDPDAPVEPMTRTEHRLGPNYLRNHPWLGKPVTKKTDIFAEMTNATSTFAGVFEADDRVGWFYLYRFSVDGESKIIDAAHVLNGAPDFTESDVQVRWFDNETRVGVLIRSTLYAYFDTVSGMHYSGRYPTRPLAWPSQ